MKKIKTEPLFIFLNKHSGYFTSIGFFVILFSLSLVIPVSQEPIVNNLRIMLQAGSLYLVIICLFPLIKETKHNKDNLIQVFYFFIVIISAALAGYLFFMYNQLISGVIAFTSVVIGSMQLNSLQIKWRKMKKNKSKLFKQNWYSILIFSLVVLINILIIKNGDIFNIEFQINSYNAFFDIIGRGLFLGYAIYIALYLIFGLLPNLFKKVFSK